MIKLPELFEQKLDCNQELSAAVRNNLEQFTPWLSQSGMPFFPGFTDHGPRHINDVLSAAASLISDYSHDLLSSEDIAVLTLAILLHDCGMHLTQDVFRELISRDEVPIVSGFHDLPWAKLWKDFLSEARRFGQDKLIAIFGDSDPFLIDELDINNLSERDCYLIGEFVRRHHTRIAHEIALAGIPQKTGHALQLNGLDGDFKDLAGLVARSHGMSIRNTAQYVQDKYGLFSEYRRIKTPFLMAVLRIADYIQVKSERALKSLLSVKELRSPVSRQEWRNHFAVRDVSMRHEDPEALYVHAVPTDVRTYLKLESLLRDIQRELDETWATLGEVYGRQHDLSKLGITIRRVRSNLDSKDTFSRSVSYLPIKAGFDSSGPDLLKLLVGPLYGYDFSVGIRELLQNAVDACRELSDLERTNIADTGKYPEPSVTVEVTENEDGSGWVVITDTGVGMTVETVTQYFLVAGASFRNSDIWKKQHIDESGQTRVLRGGRFGIGALAAFLLGDEISVTTRHVGRSSSEGIEFKARIDDSTIELRRCNAPNGTTIKVLVTDSKIFERLRPYAWWDSVKDGEKNILNRWNVGDWFVQASPKIEYLWDGFSIDHDEADRVRYQGSYSPNKDQLVPNLGKLENGWQAIPDPEPYQAIYWRYEKPQIKSQQLSEDEDLDIAAVASEISINGIRVLGINEYGGRSYYLRDIAYGNGPEFVIKRPSIAIFDLAGLCPINLQRSSIAFERMGIDGRLAKEMLRQHLTELRNLLGDGIYTIGDFVHLCNLMNNKGGVIYPGQITPFFVTTNGISLLTPDYLVSCGIRNLIFLDIADSKNLPSLSTILKEDEGLVVRNGGQGIQADLAWFRVILSHKIFHEQRQRAVGLPKLERAFSVSAMPSKKWAQANEKGRVSKPILESLSAENLGESHVLVSPKSGDFRSIRKRVGEILNIVGGDAEVAAWTQLSTVDSPEQNLLIEEVWGEVFGSDMIPFKF